MTTRRLATVAFVLSSLGTLAVAQPSAPATAESLVGIWSVDLRPSPDAAPYLKKLVITSVRDGRLEGQFYDGSPLQAGRINVRATQQLHFAFFTDPGEGAYQSSGRQTGPDRLEGMTLSTTRGFLMPWVALREGGR